MFYFKPSLLGTKGLPDDELKADKTSCFLYGRCGVGQKALYLSSFFLDRRYYVPAAVVRRAYKRVAMSKGGFTGKGIFGTIPYLVVEYEGGTIQCTFKREETVDLMIAEIGKRFPKIKTISEAAAKKLEIARAQEEARYKKHLSPAAKSALEELRRAKAYLEERPDLAVRLAHDSKALRVNRMTAPWQKWLAASIFGLAFAAALYGLWDWLAGSEADYGLYITLIGFAVMFSFSGAKVLPTARNNQAVLTRLLEGTRKELEDYIAQYPGFPLPARYAHPMTLARMIRSIREGRSETIPTAFADMKAVLKKLNASVQVSQTEYDEVTAVKPMFLLEDYK